MRLVPKDLFWGSVGLVLAGLASWGFYALRGDVVSIRDEARALSHQLGGLPSRLDKLETRLSLAIRACSNGYDHSGAIACSCPAAPETLPEEADDQALKSDNPDEEEALSECTELVDAAVARGRWTQEDHSELQSLGPRIGSRQVECWQLLAKNINAQQLKVEVDSLAPL